MLALSSSSMNPSPTLTGSPAQVSAARDWLWHPAAIVFISNMCVMVIELVAGRLVAPLVGNSLYTWTSIIGVILAGISLGNYIGGRLADRYASRRFLGVTFLLAALGSLSVLLLVEVVGSQGLPLIKIPLIARMILFITLIFFLPSVLLGLISPIVIKLTLNNLAKTGNVIGRIYAASSLGSIVGTFATGYFLISWFGSRSVVLGVSVLLAVMGLLLGNWFRNSNPARSVLASLSVIALSTGLLFVPPIQRYLKSACLVESDYYCIKARDEKFEGVDYKILTLDHLVHSYNAVGDPLKLRYSYEQVGAELAQFLVNRDGKLDMLFIGGGGYTLPRYVEALWPDAKIDVAEVDPAVTRVAYEHLDVPANPNIVTYNMDARQYLISNAGNKRYNFILGDAFNDFSVPYHLTTQEFNHLVKDHLADDGVYMLNLIDGGDLPFATAVMRTLRSVFPYVYFLPVNKAYIETQRNTMLVLASSQPIDMTKLGMIPGSDRERQSADWLVSQPQLDALLAKGPQFLLTDDYVPTEQLLTPVFESANAVK